ncbi:hypothetical protein Leryth_012982 [Lithospermum erythrorhizon]|nr:hypothetical protein Leryth_012982 [Lithospermum erythrorhizon]
MKSGAIYPNRIIVEQESEYDEDFDVGEDAVKFGGKAEEGKVEDAILGVGDDGVVEKRVRRGNGNEDLLGWFGIEMSREG